MAPNPEFWRDRRVLVTGCSGFVGSWLALHLVELQAQVVGLVRRLSPRSHLSSSGVAERIDLQVADVTDGDAVQHAVAATMPDTVFHLAAQAYVQVAERNPVDTLRSNVQGTWNVLEAVRRTPGVRRVVVASSDKAYGSPRERPLPYTEDHALQGEYPYDVSKSCADLLTQSYFHTYWNPQREDVDGLVVPRVGITRCGNIYGGGDFGQGRLVPEIALALLRDERPLVRGHGQHVRDFLYVLDAVSGYLTLAEQLDRAEVNGRAFNFANERPQRVIDLVEKLTAITGKDLEPEVARTTPQPGEILEQWLSAEQARSVLGWQPVYDVERGLADTVRWYSAWLETEPTTGAMAEVSLELLRRYEQA